MSIETLNLRKNVWWMCMMVWVFLFFILYSGG